MEQQAIVKARVNWAPAALALPFLAALLFWPGIFPIDDAYITLSNARVFLSGQPDPVFGTSYMTGATSPAHLLIVALAGLVVEPTHASMLIGVAGAVLYVLALRRIVRSAGLESWRCAAFVFVGAAWGYSLFQYLNGLETSLAMAAAAWLLVWQDDKRKLAVLSGFAPFLRPELAVLGGLLMLRLGWRLRDKPKDVVAMFALASLVATPWAVWVYSQTDHVFPSTMGAKLAFFREWVFPIYLKIPLAWGALFYSLQLPLFIGLIGLRRSQWPALLFVLLGVGAAVVLMPNSLNWNEGRYSSVFLPILIMGLASIASEKSRAGTAVFYAFVAGTFATFALGVFEYKREIEYAYGVRDHARYVATLPASSVVLIHDAGQVAWEQPKAKLVDMVGLKTLGIEPLHDRYSPMSCHWDKALDMIARQYQVTHVVVLNRWMWPCLTDNFTNQGWHLKPTYNGLYTVYEVSRSKV